MYKPPTKVVTTETPWLAMVTRADPEFARQKFREVFYERSDGKVFIENPYQQGPYSRKGNVYPVGQPYGALDPLIQAALAPTAGNSSPGLYEGIDDGEGWA